MRLEELMRLAIEKGEQAIQKNQTPFGCAIALDGRILAASHNTVWASTDITCHAEVNAIRVACRELGSIFLEGASVASTCEPCPMCMSALHWARVETVCYGATIADASRAGFNELELSAASLLEQGGSDVKLVSGILTAECQALFDAWKLHGSQGY